MRQLSGTDLESVLQLDPVLPSHLDDHVQLALHLLELVAQRLQGGVVERLCIKERVLQYHLHLALAAI